MKTPVSRPLSASLIFGLLSRGAAAGADSSPSQLPRRRGRASRAGWTLAALTLVALAGSARPARAQLLRIDDADYHNSPYLYSDASGTQTYEGITVGLDSTGTFNQTGGTLTVTREMDVASSRGASGTYNLSGGSLSVGSLVVGFYGHGAFYQTGGTFTIPTNNNSAYGGRLLVGFEAGSNGAYNLSAGSLSTQAIFVGEMGTGAFNQTGGTVTTAGSLVLGNSAGGNGTYNLSAGSLTAGASYNSVIGNDGMGTFTQTGGTFSTSGNALLLANQSDGTGIYKLSAGSVTAGYLDVGFAGTGTFTQTGGSVTTIPSSSTLNANILGVLAVGDLAGSTGTYNLSDSGQGSSLSTNTVFVGGAGTGTFNQSGGTFTTNNYPLRIGNLAGGNGTFNLSGTGSLSTGTVFVGNDGVGTFNQTGGTFTNNGNYLYLGAAADGTGTYNLDGGVLTAGHVNGSTGTSTFNFNGGTLQASGNNTDFLQGLTTANVRNGGAIIDTNGYNVTAAQSLVHSTVAGDNVGDGGLTKLGGATLTLTGANTYTGQTLVNQGTLAVTGGGSIGTAGTMANLTVNLGTNATPTAPTLALSGNGTQVFFNNAFIGSTARGNVSQSGGTFTTSNVLYLGYSDTNATTGNGVYTFTGGTLNANETQVGNGGVGTFNHSGGTQTVTTTLYLGLNNGMGTYNLSGNGVLQASSGVVGYTGNGSFNQTGGAANFGTGGLTVGSTTSGFGTYQLGTGSSGGAAATLNSLGPVYVGYGGNGTVTQQVGGSLSTNGYPLYLGYNTGSRGTFNLSGGEVDTANGSTVGYAGTGVFNHTGGADIVSGTLVLGHAAGSSGTYNLSGGALVVGQVTSQGGTSTFNFNGGTLQAGGNNANFFQGLTTANVRNGGATIDTQGHNVTVAQPLLHSNVSGDNATDGGLTKFSAGVLTLTGANTYNGGTRVQGGTLLVGNTSGSGTGSGQVTVGNNAVLGGGGTIGGGVVAQGGSTVAPGAAALATTARLTLGGTLSLQTNALLAIKLGGSTGGSGGYDQVFAAGGFTLGGNLQVSLVNGFVPTLNQSFTILDNTGGGTNSGVFANAPGGVYTDAAGDRFAVNYLAIADGDLVPNDVTLTYLGTTAVPEPGTWAWLLVGAGALTAWGIRRRLTGLA